MLSLSPWSGRGRDARIFVKSLTGRKMLVTVALEGSAFRLKQLLETTEGVPVGDMRLIYSGKQLADDKPLEFYNIQAGGTIHMVAALGWLRKLPSPSVLARKKARESLDPFLARCTFNNDNTCQQLADLGKYLFSGSALRLSC